LLQALDEMLSGEPQHIAVARAMLLGDRSFIEHDRAEAYQKTGVYHVLVLAGLHVAALAALLFWIARRLRFSMVWTALFTLAGLCAFAAIVEDRPPILRATLMAAAYLASRVWFRRVPLIHVVSLAALAILAFRPSELTDASFLLSFLAAGSIAALALPWIDASSEPYRRALDHLGDVTRDAAHAPRPAQFRLDVRAASRWLAARVPRLRRGWIAWSRYRCASRFDFGNSSCSRRRCNSACRRCSRIISIASRSPRRSQIFRPFS
jgi:competence protein ComEC